MKRLHSVWLYYYEKIEPIFAEIVPLEHDLFECLKIDEEFEREAKCESFKVYFGKYTELTKMLKNETLLHQAYIPKTVFEESTTFVVQMQDDFDYWFDMAKCLFAGEYGKIDYEKGEKTVEMLLVKLAKMEVSIKIDWRSFVIFLKKKVEEVRPQCGQPSVNLR